MKIKIRSQIQHTAKNVENKKRSLICGIRDDRWREREGVMSLLRPAATHYRRERRVYWDNKDLNCGRTKAIRT